MMVNKLFEEEIKKVVGDSTYAELKKTPAYRCALRDFDGAIKPAFRGRNDPDRFVSFPMAGLEDNPARGLLSNSMALSGLVFYITGKRKSQGDRSVGLD